MGDEATLRAVQHGSSSVLDSSGGRDVVLRGRRKGDVRAFCVRPPPLPPPFSLCGIVCVFLGRGSQCLLLLLHRLTLNERVFRL